MLSILILTKNEEQDLPGCLESVAWCSDIHVIDSGSSDRTQKIAEKHGATVVENPFESFGKQRNWALDHCETRNDWILFLDADERSTPQFETALIPAIRDAPDEVAGFYCCWKMMLGDTWLKRSDNFPKWQFRLLRKGRARFTDFGHGQKEGEIDGEIAYLSEPYLHYAFSSGWDAWEVRHRKYAMQEAIARKSHKLQLGDLFSTHSSKRNPAIKLLVGRLPGWPMFRFCYSYFLKGGFLEGNAGFTYCKKMMWYEAEIQKVSRYN